MNFYLKEPKSQNETLIYIIYSSKNFKFSTGEKIHPDNWDFDRKLPKIFKGVKGAKLKNITTKLLIYQNFLDTLLSNLKINTTPITKDLLRDEFKAKFKPGSSNTKPKFKYYTDFLKDFVDNAHTLTNRNTNRKYTNVRIKHYKKTYQRLLDFEKHRKSKIKINGFDLNVYDEFIDYFTITKKYSVTYAGDMIKNIKVFMKKAEELGYQPHKDYKSKEFAVIKEESIAIALNEEEINLMLKHDFSDNKRLENCRDIAILGMWTGLRVSDLMALPNIEKDEKFITVQPNKTKGTSGVKVVIPLHHNIKEVLEKRGMPRFISDVKFNLYIKEVCQEVGIKEMVKGSLMNPETKRKEVDIFPKYKLVSSHTCRRSFATNLYLMNFPTLSIMKITGHTTEKSFLAYIKVTPKEHAEKLLKYWDNYYENKHII